MATRFDPYHVWLGIAPDEQPPSHYRLLGLRPFEAEPAVIDHAADRQMVHVRTFHAGKHAEQAQRLLNELASARLCLLNPQRKAAYDASLRAEQEKKEAASRAAAPPAPPPPHHSDPALDVLAAVVARDHGGSSLKLHGGSSLKTRRPAGESGAKLAPPPGADGAAEAAPAPALLKRPVVWIGSGALSLCVVGVVVGVIVANRGNTNHVENPKPKREGGQKSVASTPAPPTPTRVRINWPLSEREDAALKVDGAPVQIGAEDSITVSCQPNATVRIEAFRKGFEPFLADVTAKAGATTGVKLVWSRPPPPKMIVPTSEEQAQLYRYTTTPPPPGWQQPDFDDQTWQEAPGAFGQGSNKILTRTAWQTSDIYLRRTFFLAAVEDGLLLRVAYDDDARIYINGVEAAACSGHSDGAYRHVTPFQPARDALRIGNNVLAVHCHQGGGGQYIDVGLVQVASKPSHTGPSLEINWALHEREGAELTVNDKPVQLGFGNPFGITCRPNETFTIEARRTGYEPFRKTVTSKENGAVVVRIEWPATIGTLSGPARPFVAVAPTAEQQSQRWRYSLSSPPLTWNEPSFDDSAWSEAPAPFGQGFTGTNTPWTTAQIYLRRKVELPQGASPSLMLRLRHDDDATVWINGVEAATCKGRATEYKNVPIDAAVRKAIQPGVNVLAVYCSQASEGQFIDVGLVEETGVATAAPPVDRPGETALPNESPASAGKRPSVPEGETLEQAQARVREGLKDAYARAVKPEDKIALARELLVRVEQGGEAADRYATLQAARRCALDAPDLETLVSVVDAMAASFDIDAPQMMASGLDSLTRGAPKASVKKSLAEQALKCCDAAVENDQLAIAQKLGHFGSSLAVGDKDLAREWKARDELLKAVERTAEEVKAAKAVLAKNADDATASVAVGRYLCFVKGDYTGGLPLLVRGDDAALKTLAEKELQSPSEADARAALGDAWCDWRAKAKSFERRQIERRIVHWYFLAYPSLSAVRRPQVEAKLNGLDVMKQKTLDRIVNRKDGSVLVLVRPGRFIAGGIGEKDSGEIPFPVDLPAYYIGMYEVTNRQYKKFMDATGHRAPDPDHWMQNEKLQPAWQDGNYLPELADHPVVCVSWNDAREYCRWAGLRLPGELEWEKAARGPDGRLYPWGNTFDARFCRSGHTPPSLIPTVPVGSMPEGCSPYGLFHMAGNAKEWCDDVWDQNAYTRYRRGDFSKASSGGDRLVRSGMWRDKDGVRTTFRHHHGNGEVRQGIGIRVAKDFSW